jgi:hypothetical protein
MQLIEHELQDSDLLAQHPPDKEQPLNQQPDREVFQPTPSKPEAYTGFIRRGRTGIQRHRKKIFAAGSYGLLSANLPF